MSDQLRTQARRRQLRCGMLCSDKGTEFECTVTTADGDLQVTATVISEGDEDVRFEIKGVTEAK